MLPFCTSLSVQGYSTPIEKHVHFITFEGRIQAGGDFSKAESDKMQRFSMLLLCLWVAAASARIAAISDSGRENRMRAACQRLRDTSALMRRRLEKVCGGTSWGVPPRRLRSRCGFRRETASATRCRRRSPSGRAVRGSSVSGRGWIQLRRRSGAISARRGASP